MNLDATIAAVEQAGLADAAHLMRTWRTALVTLATRSHYSPRDRTGQESTRRVQTIAARALRGDQTENERTDG